MLILVNLVKLYYALLGKLCPKHVTARETIYYRDAARIRTTAARQGILVSWQGSKLLIKKKKGLGGDLVPNFAIKVVEG